MSLSLIRNYTKFCSFGQITSSNKFLTSLTLAFSKKACQKGRGYKRNWVCFGHTLLLWFIGKNAPNLQFICCYWIIMKKILEKCKFKDSNMQKIQNFYGNKVKKVKVDHVVKIILISGKYSTNFHFNVRIPISYRGSLCSLKIYSL